MAQSGGDEISFWAERLDQVSGDAFGNRASHLWRCRVCRGHFIATDPLDSSALVMGTVPLLGLERHNQQVASAAEKGKRLVASNPCECDYHRRSRDR